MTLHYVWAMVWRCIAPPVRDPAGPASNAPVPAPRQVGQCGPNAPGGDSKPIYYNILHNIRPGSAGIGRARPIRRRTVFCSSVLIFLCGPKTPGDSGSIDSDRTGSASVGPPTPRSERLSLRRRARTASQPGAALSLCGVTQRRLRGIRPAQRRADGSVLSASMPYTRRRAAGAQRLPGRVFRGLLYNVI